MHVLGVEKRARIVKAMAEGASLRAITRMEDVAKGTVLKLLVDLGTACRQHHDAHVHGLHCRRVQCDEIWAYVAAKDKNVLPDEVGFGRGSVWTWVALDADHKLVVSYHIGTRDAECAYEFMRDVASRIVTRIQLTTDGLRAYINAVGDAFGLGGIDYAQLVKLYGEAPAEEARYSPPICIGTAMTPIVGSPDADHVSTSYVERQNLTMRMHMRRFTRLTNAFSKKVANLEHACAIHFAHYNWCRVHQSLRVTPAMAAGLTDHVWDVEELLALMPKPVVAPWGSKQGRRPTAKP
jgi:IS1 family transposase